MSKTSKIYVDIESLLDIRQAILYNLTDDKDKLTEYLLSEEYNFREIDNFINVDQNLFNSINKNKSKDLLSASTLTYILQSLKSKINNLEKRNTFYNENKTAEIILNLYPFSLTAEETKHIQNLLFVKLKTNVIINVINIDNRLLSPFYIKQSEMVCCFIYNFKDWMDHHSASLEKNKLNDTTLYFPSIYYEDHGKENLEEIKKLGFKDIFSYIEFLFSSVANISFLPTVFYSNYYTANYFLNKFNTVLKNKDLDITEEEKAKYEKMVNDLDIK